MTEIIDQPPGAGPNPPSNLIIQYNKKTRTFKTLKQVIKHNEN